MVRTQREYVRNHKNTLFPQPNDGERNTGISWLQKEQYEVEREIIRLIHSGNTDLLKPNCPNGITIREHCICVLLYEQNDPEFRVWEWHGHILMYDPQSGYYKLEYIHGHYYERLSDEFADGFEAQLEELRAVDGGYDVDQNVNDDSPRFVYRPFLVAPNWMLRDLNQYT